jgi:hypothetical protein
VGKNFDLSSFLRMTMITDAVTILGLIVTLTGGLIVSHRYILGLSLGFVTESQ